MTDNGSLGFWYVSLTTAVKNAQEYARTQVYHPTDVNTFMDSALVSTTDVIVRNQDYTTYCGYSWHPGSIWGLTTCNSLSGSRCQSHTVRYDISYFNAASTSSEQGLACHETGHTLGLTHRDTDSRCMQRYGPYPNTLASHDIWHLNANY